LRRGGGSIFVGDVSLMNILEYIYQLHVTDEYILILLGTEEYKELYSLALDSMVTSSVNREIYPIFLGSIAIFVGCNR
jgi:hypothetical protein